MNIDTDCPLSSDGPMTLEAVIGRWHAYQKLRKDSDMRSWAADQLHDDIRFLLKLGGEVVE